MPFQKGHSTSNEIKAKISATIKQQFRNGRKPTNWKGGRRKNRGYVYILFPTHPFARKDGYIFEHRLVMEKEIGRYLKSQERVHHINKILTDNRIKNLILFANAGEHHQFHKKSPNKITRL